MLPKINVGTRLLWIILLLSAFPTLGHSQSADRSIFRFLALPPSPRSASLGTGLAATLNPDADMMMLNPAFLDHRLHGQWSASYENRLGNIGRSVLSGAHQLKNKDQVVGLSIQYLNYGQIEQRTVDGSSIGQTQPYEFQLSGAFSQFLGGGLNLGVAAHWIQARYARAFTSAVALSGGLYYKDLENGQSFGLSIAHIGTTIQQAGSLAEPFPFEIRAGYSKKLAYLPLEWHLGLRHLNRWELLLPGEHSDEVSFGTMLGRHMQVGLELSIAQRLQLRAGYEPWRNQNLSASDTFDFSGTYLGWGLKLKRFSIHLSRNVQGDLGPQWQLGLVGKFDRFM